MRVTNQDITMTPSGYHRLPCDGRHDHSYHFYMYYTKREILKKWRDEHPKEEDHCFSCDYMNEIATWYWHEETNVPLCAECAEKIGAIS